MSYGMSITIGKPFSEVLPDVRGALADQGFGVITEINMQETLRAKIGVEIPEQIILGACSPRHAHRALQAEPSAGLLLPCNVVVRATAGGTLVETINPQIMVDLTGNPRIREVADEITRSLQAVLDSLTNLQ